jgi:hypothetical protein
MISFTGNEGFRFLGELEMLAPGLECLGGHDGAHYIASPAINDVQSSHVSIPEIGGKCDPFDASTGNSAKYLGHKASKRMKKADNE